MAVSPLIAEDAHAAETCTLHWANGDELVGQILSAGDGRLVWHSDVLSRPVSLDLGVLESVTGLEREDAVGDLDDWRISLSTGDVIYGNLVRIDSGKVTIDSTRHGRVTVGREWIEQFERSGHDHPVDLIKAAGSGWQSVDPAWNQKGSGLTDWTTTEPREISTDIPGARLFFPTELPDKCQIELHVECRSRLGFSLALGGIEHLKQRTGDLEIETWGDELVMQSASATGEFKHLKRIALQTKSASVRVFWDRTQGRVFVFDKTGRTIVDARIDPAEENASRGVLLENKGENLTVRMLRIGHWNGVPSPSVVFGADRLRTIHGGEHYGDVTGPDADGRMRVDPPEGEPQQVLLEDIVEIAFPVVVVSEAPAEGSQLRFRDGTTVKGDLVSIEEGVASVAVPFLTTDLPVHLRGLRTATFKPSETVTSGGSSHVLKFQGLTLHGRLAPAKMVLGWRLVGADDVIPLSTDSALRITRLADSPAVADEPLPETDLAYLVGGDQIPCRVEHINEQFVTLTTSLSDATRIDRSELQAIEFDVRGAAELTGFTSPGWKTQGGQLRARTAQRIVFEGNAQIAHPDLLRGGMCEFDVQWDKTAQTLLFLSLSPDGTPFANSQQMFYLIFNGNSVQVHTRSGRGVQRANVTNQPLPEAKLTLRLETSGQRINLIINDKILGTLDRNDPRNPMVAVTIGCQPMNARGNQRAPSRKLTLSNLRTGRGSGLFRGVALTEIGRRHIVTVPRSRRHHPPSVVVVAKNGDLLRGELVALNRTAIAFRSRLEDVSIPMERVAGLVFLPEPDDPFEPAPRPDGLVQTTLRGGIVLNVIPQQVASDQILGTHPVLGPCRVNLAAVSELKTGELMSEVPRRVFTEWTLVHAPEPIIPGVDGNAGFGTYSQLVGQPAEDFSLPMLDGEVFRLSDHRGKVVVLDFWASWCGPCIQALPQLTSATSVFSLDDVVFLAVNQRESQALIQEFLQTRDWDFPVALDISGEIGGLYRVEGLPQTVIVGRGGEIEHVHLGVSPNLEAELTETLEKLLQQQSDQSEPAGSAEE